MNDIQIGNSPCSWGALEFDGLAGEPIKYQQMLDELVETGYTGTELGDWGFMPTDPVALRTELRRRNLTMLGAFVPVALKNPNAHDEGQANALKVARLLASVMKIGNTEHRPFIVLADDNGTNPVRTQNAGRVTSPMQLNEAEWRIFAQGAERIAKAAQSETGLRTVFHHHCAGYIETSDETARLLDLTDPSLLGLVFDTGHYMYGSGSSDPECVLEGLERFAERIWYIHFKDCQPKVAHKARSEGWDYFKAVEHGIFCELGQGCVDFAAVVNWLHKSNYRGWICVEQDVLPGMGMPKESALRNREYLKKLRL